MFNIEKCIKNALRESGKTAEGLAAESGMTKQTLYRLFNRDDAKLSQLESLAKALGVSIYETFEVEGAQQAEVKPSEDIQGSSIETKRLQEKIDLLEDYNMSLKQHVATLERELSKYHKDPGDDGSRGPRQTG